MSPESNLPGARAGSAMTGPVSRSAPSSAGIAAVFVAAYVILEWISFIHEYKALPVTPWNPGLGLVFALMLYGGARYAPVLFAGVILSEIVVLRSGLSWLIVLGIATIIALGYAAIATVVRQRLRLDAALNRLRDVFLLLTAGTLGAAIVALLLSLLLIADAQLDLADVLVAAGPLLVGDAIGIAVITPLTLRLILRKPHLSMHVLRALAPEIMLYVAVVTLSLWITVGTESATGFKFFYLFFLPVVVAAVRYGLDGACFGLALTQLSLVGLLHWHGYDAQVFTEFQILMLVLTATGLTVGVVVTERQQANLAVRQVEARLRVKEAEAAQAARINLVSGMASALAHEINQPMTAARALGRAVQQLLRQPTPDPARADSNLTTMIAQIDHAASVVRRMRDFLRRGQPHFSTLDPKTLIEEALILVREDANARSIRIELDTPDDLPPVHADRIQLQQVILNLVRNAMDAIAATGRADGRIRIAVVRFDAPPRIEIGIADNGPGIVAAVAERLFEPLTTSKQDGLGLGLSICSSIVQSHGGRIWLETATAGATEFRFSLPLERAQAD